MDKQLAQHRTQEQGSRIATAAHLNYEFATISFGASILSEVGVQDLERKQAWELFDRGKPNGPTRKGRSIDPGAFRAAFRI
jgi:hypothetical protein